MTDLSPLQKARYSYQPKLPQVLRSKISQIAAVPGEPTESVADQGQVKDLFPFTYGSPIIRFTPGENPNAGKPLRIGVVLSGGQAPGGHSVITGLYDAMKAANSQSLLYGFLNGPSGLIEGKTKIIDEKLIQEYKNTGGFDIIGSGRTKLETEEQFEKSLQVCREKEISAVVVIGGDDSNTNAAVLAEWFKKKEAGVMVIGCPKTIDGDLKNQHVEISFGFDTAVKTFSELAGNIERDAHSAKKYWHFIKLMGRSASHIALECALQTQPNICIISEEIKARGMSLEQVVNQIADVVAARAALGRNYGVVLVPEGLIEFIPEAGQLIHELNELLAREASFTATLKTLEDQREWASRELSKDSSYVFSSLPRGIQEQLLMDRDPHGNVQVSRVETEKLLIEMVEDQLNRRKIQGTYKGSFSPQAHFFGYEGRCAFPTNFDTDYCFSLGYTAFLLISQELTGYMANVSQLHQSAENWVAGGIPLTMMMNMEQRHGKQKPVIRKALVDLEGPVFAAFAKKREQWAVETCYTYPGSIQYYGPSELCDTPNRTLLLEKGEAL